MSATDKVLPLIPYGRQTIDDDDVRAVAEVLRSDFLTTGPKVAEFEQAVCARTGAGFGVAVNSGTAALHCAMHALRIGPGDEVVVPPITFAATANCVRYEGATPVFADVDPETLLLDPACVAEKITPRTKAIIAVDFAGQPCDWDALRALADAHGLPLVADGCHALGAEYKGRPVGTLADMTCFSFHPVKHVATGEGGMTVTGSEELATAMRTFRTHGITADYKAREAGGTWVYEMVELGFNYRITDIQCALGISQLSKQEPWLARRREIAARYAAAFAAMDGVRPLGQRPEIVNAWHLYVIRVAAPLRRAVFEGLRARAIGVNVHYIPVHLHPYYRREMGTGEGLCPVAEAAYGELISLPMYPALTDADVDRVVAAVGESLAEAEGR